MMLTIETAELSQYKLINEIVKEGHQEHVLALPHIFKQVENVMPESYYKELLTDPNSDVLVAIGNGEVVGYAVIELKEAPAFDSMMPRVFAYVNDIGVKGTYQRKGVGKDLFDACVMWAKTKGASSLELNVWEFNERAISFYTDKGMISTSRKMTLDIKE